MKRLIAAFGVVVGLAASSSPGAPPPPSTTTIPALLSQLGAEEYADREAAAKALGKLGMRALPALEAAARSEDPEVRERAAVLAARLRHAAENTACLAPRRVQLDYRDIPIGTAVNDLRARTGLPITLDGTRIANPLRHITCVTTELPLWEALDAFCRAADLRELFVNDLNLLKPAGPRRAGFVPPPDPKADAMAIVLLDGKPDRLPGSRSTAVRVLALPAGFPGHRTTIGTGECTLCLDITPAPTLDWVDVTGVKVSRVIDSSGRPGTGGVERYPLPSPAPAGMVLFARPGVAVRFDPTGYPMMPDTIPNPRVVRVPLRIATPTAQMLRRLEGAVLGEMRLLNQPLVTITDLRSSSGKTFLGPNELKVKVLEVKSAARGSQGLIRVQLEYPSPWVVNARKRGMNFAFNPGWPEPPPPPSLSRSLHAYDASGKQFPVSTSGYSDFSDDGMFFTQTFHFTFRGESGLPAKLVVAGPKSVFVEVPFAMENVPLP